MKKTQVLLLELWFGFCVYKFLSILSQEKMTSAKKWSNLQKFNSWNEIEQYLDVSNFKYLSKVQINELPRTQNTKLPSAKWPFLYKVKVEKILKGSLDSIPSPSPSVKIQFMVGIAGHCQQTFGNKKFVYITQQCFALLPQVNFPDNNLNFHRRWRWWDHIHGTFLNLFYLNNLETPQPQK